MPAAAESGVRVPRWRELEPGFGVVAKRRRVVRLDKLKLELQRPDAVAARAAVARYLSVPNYRN